MNSSKNWDLQVNPSVYKELKKVPRKNVEAILEIIRLLPENPYFGDVKKMKGANNGWRRRTGSYHVFYKIDMEQNVILVFHIERKTSKTY